MILVLIHDDRVHSDQALITKDASKCQLILRPFLKNACLSKIAERKEQYCHLLPESSLEECLQNEVLSLKEQVQQSSTITTYLLFLFEMTFLASLTLWVMGLIPEKLIRRLKPIYNLSTVEDYIILRALFSGIIIFALYFLQLQLSLV